MNKILIPVLFVLMSSMSFGQNASVVQVQNQVVGNDTLRTFFIDGRLCTDYIVKLTAMYGVPEGDGTGTMRFPSVSVPGIGTNIEMLLNDGAMMFDGTNMVHSTFLNAADAEAKLSHDPASMRRMFVTLKINGANPVNTIIEANSMIVYSENVLFN